LALLSQNLQHLLHHTVLAQVRSSAAADHPSKQCGSVPHDTLEWVLLCVARSSCWGDAGWQSAGDCTQVYCLSELRQVQGQAKAVAAFTSCSSLSVFQEY
jgi:hypothetical protein